MSFLLPLAALLALTFLSALCSGMETGLYALDRVRLQLRGEDGDGRARRLFAAAQRPAATVAALLVANNVVNYFVADAASRALDEVVTTRHVLVRQVVDTLLVAPFLFICGDLAPKDAFLRAPHRLMRRFEPFLTGVRLAGGVVLAPLLWLAEKLRGGDDESGSDFDRAAIGRMFNEEAEVAALSPAQRRLAERVLRLRQSRVEERMTSLDRVAAVAAEATADAVAALGAKVGKSRLPVRASGEAAFVGYVNVADALAAVGEGDGERPGFAGRALHELPKIPLRATISSALVRFQRRRRPLMQVVTREGRAAGILAASDLVDALFDP
jgi:CBS domain containing-hemolysin-like protein